MNVWKSKSQILEGIKNRIFTSETVKEIADARMEICKSCNHIDNEGGSCVVPGSAPCCKLCGCTLYLATASLSYKCKAGNWETAIDQYDDSDLVIAVMQFEKLDQLLAEKKVLQEEYDTLSKKLISDNFIERFEARDRIEFLIG